MVNSIIWSNTASVEDPEINVDPLRNGSIDITYSDIQQDSGIYSGTGNINADPLFLSPATRNYRLTPGPSGSPSCIDSANSDDPAPATDKDGNSRINYSGIPNTGAGSNGPVYDMGAYEFTAAVCTDDDEDGYYLEAVCSGLDIDCDDNAPTTYPGAPELCNGVDDDCSGDPIIPVPGEIDGDGDSYRICEDDCDDDNPAIHPVAIELCDNQDNDCDPDTSDGSGEDWIIDTTLCDGDDTDQCKEGELICSDGLPECTDNTSNTVEVCDGQDNDCDDQVDEGVKITVHLDSDEDGYPAENSGIQVCDDARPPFYITVAPGWDEWDCDDSNDLFHPNAVEFCDRKDNDCDLQIDEGLATSTRYRDSDNDDYGDPNDTVDSCGPRAGYIDVGGDCDDSNDTILNSLIWYEDADQDGYSNGTIHNSTVCDLQDINYKAQNDPALLAITGDCRDDIATVYPFAPEVCDGFDNDCDGTFDNITLLYYDYDQDGYGNPGISISDCDPTLTNYVINSADCNDQIYSINPSITETCRNAVDENCDGQLNEICLQLDIYVPGDFPSIQAAIDYSIDGETILVADGIYTENINFNNKAITIRSENGPLLTTIDGNGSGSVVIFDSGEGSGSLLEGFAITNGSAINGGGILISNNSSPSVESCIVKNNTASNNGGGVYCGSNSSPILDNLILAGNSANDGGGVYGSGSPLITNCTFYDNTAANSGGGIYGDATSTATVDSSILWADTDSSGSNEIYLDTGGVIDINFSDIQGDYTGSNNINLDPSFADVSIEDYHLLSASDCIGAGDPNNATLYDFEGDSRDSAPDMGADEYSQLSATIDLIDPYPSPPQELVYEGETIYFAGTGVPGNGKEITLYEWRSSINGLLAIVPSFYYPLLSDGTHTITFAVEDGSGRAEVTQQLEIEDIDATIGSIPDLALEWGDISFHPYTLDNVFLTNPGANIVVQIKAEVHNIGAVDSSSPVTVNFYYEDGSSSTPITTVNISGGIKTGDSRVAKTNWTTPVDGSYVVRVVVDMDTAKGETYQANNTATHFIMIGTVQTGGDEAAWIELGDISLSADPSCPYEQLTVSGGAEYVFSGGQSRIPVAGGAVNVEILGNVWQANTAISGQYSVPVLSPGPPGEYLAKVTVSDSILSANKLVVLTVSQGCGGSGCEVDLVSYADFPDITAGEVTDLAALIINAGYQSVANNFNVKCQIFDSAGAPVDFTGLGGSAVNETVLSFNGIGATTIENASFGSWTPAEEDRGRYLIRIDTDTDDVVDECSTSSKTNEYNNMFQRQFYVNTASADLTPISLEPELSSTRICTIDSSTSVRLDAVIRNVGGTDSSSTTVRFEVDGTIVDTQSLGGLPKIDRRTFDDRQSVSGQWDLSVNNHSFGTYRVCAIVSDAVDSNNELCADVTISDATGGEVYDPKVTNIQFTRKYRPDNRDEVLYTDTPSVFTAHINLGTPGCDPITPSSDARVIFTVGDAEIGRVPYSPNMSTIETIPVASEDYEVCATFIDPQTQPAKNHQLCETVVVNPPSPDLRIYSGDISFTNVTPEAGEQIQIGVKVHNDCDNTEGCNSAARDASSYRLSIYANGTYLIASTLVNVNLDSGDNHLIIADWEAGKTSQLGEILDGSYSVYAVASTITPVHDPNFENNGASREIVVGEGQNRSYSDLTLEASDIIFEYLDDQQAPIPPVDSDNIVAINVQANIFNIGELSSNDPVKVLFFYDEGTADSVFIGEAVIDEWIPAGESRVARINNWTIPTANKVGYHLITAVIEQDRHESYIVNNSASHFMTIGAPPGEPAEIDTTAFLSDYSVCPQSELLAFGHAEYVWPDGAGGYFRLPALGANVAVTISGLAGRWESKTATYGSHLTKFYAPSQPGTYTVAITVTDNTLSRSIDAIYPLVVSDCVGGGGPPGTFCPDLTAYLTEPAPGPNGQVRLIEGESVNNLTVYVKNIGNVITDSQQIPKVKLEIFDPLGTLLIEAEADAPVGIAPGTGQDVTFGNWTPVDLGNHTFKITIDTVPDECTSDNNVKAIGGYVYPSEVDVKPVSIAPSEATICLGDPIVLSAQVRNFGGTSTISNTVEFFVDTSPVGSSKVYRVPKRTAADWKMKEVGISWIPTGTTGNRVVCARVDGKQETELCRDLDLTFGSIPDLAVTDITYPITFVNDLIYSSTGTITGHIENLGCGTSTTSNVMFSFNGFDLGASGPITALEPGEETTRSVTYIPPINYGPGYYPSCVALDISDSNSFNNSRCETIPLNERSSDLAVYSDDISFNPETPGLGETVQICATIRNNGILDATEYVVTFYENEVLPISTHPIVVPLLAGEGNEQTVCTNWPPQDWHPILQGTYVMMVAVSPLSPSTHDPNYSNNSATRAINPTDCEHIWYKDFDADGYTDGTSVIRCPGYEPDGYSLSAISGDCDDENPDINPGVADDCDGIDNDCDPDTADGSGETAPLNTVQDGVCSGYVQSCNGGTWEDNYSIVPDYEADAEISCDFLDNDCDGLVDDDNVKPTYYHDFDGDTYGDPTDTVQEYLPPAEYVANDLDCDDTDATVKPEGAEYRGNSHECNDGIDNDCDGLMDHADPDCTGSSEVCDNGVDDDLDDKVDCDDPNCNNDPACSGGGEILCTDSIDNDSDGNIDCADNDCNNEPLCGQEVCDDNFDNDGDGKVDCLDPNCNNDPACQQ